MNDVKNLGWGSRLALIDKYGASDEQAATAFGVPVEEIQTARELRNSGGAANMPIDIDVESYGNPFGKTTVESAPTTNIQGATSVRRPTTRTPSETATRVAPEPKKRGRKGSKINDAFAAIGTDPIPAQEFADKYNVSLNVLRQAKRFDTTGLPRVRVKKIQGTLMVFREAE